MTDQEFKEYLHESVHELIDLNDKYHEEFKVGSYARWDYDFDKAILTFSNEGVPYVVADIQAIGTIAHASKSWLWSWNNESIPEHVKSSISAVREFGESHKILKLTEDYWAASEEDGWEMSAIANRILGGKGVYRCPDDCGFVFLILTNISFAPNQR
ncbi:MAG TPA: hypothetical protein VIJ01_20385 [Candidatus Angelobacter sp.]